MRSVCTMFIVGIIVCDEMLVDKAIFGTIFLPIHYTLFLIGIIINIIDMNFICIFTFRSDNFLWFLVQPEMVFNYSLISFQTKSLNQSQILWLTTNAFVLKCLERKCYHVLASVMLLLNTPAVYLNICQLSPQWENNSL